MTETGREKKVNTFSLVLSNYVENVKVLWDQRPFFYDKTKSFWVWNKENYCWEIVDETDILVMIDKELGFAGQLATSGIRSNYLEAFRQVGRQRIPLPNEKTWVQFKNTIFDLKNKTIFEANPKYFSTNPIPQTVGESEETPVMDKLFKQWVGEKYVQTFYEIIAYCCLADYPIHILFCFIGSGRNGKSQFQKLIQKFFGTMNSCSTELDLLIDNRFESTKLFKKLVCSLGETNFEIMSKTSLLKKLTGGDLIGFEFKNKMPFDDYNYAKIIINSNSLPTSLDTSDGFYRRWMIIDFPNEFDETGYDIIDTIPEIEYSNLAKKILRILPELMVRGKFTNQGTVEERKARFIMASNPLPYFVENYCIREFNEDSYERSSEVYLAFVRYLSMNKKRVVSKKEFNKALLEEGLEARRADKKINGIFVKDYYIEFFKIRHDLWDGKNLKRLSSDFDKNDTFDDTLIPVALSCVPESEKLSKTSKTSKTEIVNPYPTPDFRGLTSLWANLPTVSSVCMGEEENRTEAIKTAKTEIDYNILATPKTFNQNKQPEENIVIIEEDVIDELQPILIKRDIKKDIFKYLDSKIGAVNIETLKEDLKIDDEVIESLKRDGLLYEPKSGFVQKL